MNIIKLFFNFIVTFFSGSENRYKVVVIALLISCFLLFTFWTGAEKKARIFKAERDQKQLEIKEINNFIHDLQINRDLINSLTLEDLLKNLNRGAYKIEK